MLSIVFYFETLIFTQNQTTSIMKNLNIHKKSLFLFIIIFLISSPLQAQDTIKSGFTFSVGFPGFFSVGIYKKVSNIKYSLRAGYVGKPCIMFCNYVEKYTSVSAEVHYYFETETEIPKENPFYLRGSMNYYQRKGHPYRSYKFISLNTRVGKHFKVSKKNGIEIDAGVLFRFYRKEIEVKPKNGGYYPDDDFILPSAGITFVF